MTCDMNCKNCKSPCIRAEEIVSLCEALMDFEKDFEKGFEKDFDYDTKAEKRKLLEEQRSRPQKRAKLSADKSKQRLLPYMRQIY